MTSPPTKYAVALFPGFQALDAFGSLDILNILSKSHTVELAVVAETLKPVSTLLSPNKSVGSTQTRSTVGQSVLPTHTFSNAPMDIEVLLVPGGAGTRDTALTEPVVAFIRDRFPRLRYLLTVCTGAALAARSGVLDGKRATSNKRAFDWVMTQGPHVDWVRMARWVTSDNVWTSSGISAGIDMMFAFVAAQYGEKVAEDISQQSEYERNTDPSRDPFA